MAGGEIQIFQLRGGFPSIFAVIDRERRQWLEDSTQGLDFCTSIWAQTQDENFYLLTNKEKRENILLDAYWTAII